MAFLGLMESSDLEAQQSNNARRQILYGYPQSAAPLTFLMSLLGDDEHTDKPKFDWFEERWSPPRGVTIANTTGTFSNTSNVDLTSGGWSQSAGDSIKVRVADASVFRVRDVIWVKDVPGTSSSIKQVRGLVTEVDTSTNRITIRLIEAVANALNSAATVGLNVVFVTTAAAEGARSKVGGTTFPVMPENYTQILRTVVGPFTRTSLKMGMKWDKTGVYQDAMKKAALRHMVALESALIWGRRKWETLVDDDGETKPLHYTGGILWFLEQWEKQNVANGGAFDYMPGAADISGSAWATTENKRIIEVNGSASEDQWEELVRRLFTRTGDSSFEKLCVCDGKFLAVLNRYFKRASIKTTQLNSKEDSYGMNVTGYESPHGIIWFKTHPLFNENPAMANSGLFLDFGYQKYRPLSDSDTQLLTNRQNPDEDGRKDEWLTEMGVEIQFPESNMFVQNLTQITL